MKKTLHILYYTIISILIPLPCLSVSPQKGNILFIDEFNENSIIPDSSIWKLCTYGNHTWGQHFKNVEGYENVKVENGVLKLKVSKDKNSYKNGGIRTTSGFPCNTRLEVKAKLTKLVKGGFPAIWQMPMDALGASQKLALSFRSMPEDNHQHISVVPPLLRQDVLQQESKPGDYIHGYMLNAGFSENILNWHKKHPDTPLRFFWDHWEEEPVKKIDSTLSFYQLDDIEFLRQMAGCKAYASTAGFESVCEAMYLGKPILMVPAHIEQECNAFDAMQNGAGIIDHNFNLSNLLRFSQNYKPNRLFVEWVKSAEYIILNEIERFAPQNTLQGMYLVEEFV
jgi:hypothetical protein